jgi:hypothetical protein
LVGPPLEFLGTSLGWSDRILDGMLEGIPNYDNNNRGNTGGPDGTSDGMSDGVLDLNSGGITVDDDGIASGKSWSRDGI